MHCTLREATKQEAQPNPATYSNEDPTFGGLPTVGSLPVSCNGVSYLSSYVKCIVFVLQKTVRYSIVMLMYFVFVSQNSSQIVYCYSNVFSLLFRTIAR